MSPKTASDTPKVKLAEFVAWATKNITGDEKGQAQIYLDRLFQAFGHAGVLDVGGQPEFRIRKDSEDGGGIAFADLVWKPIVLIETLDDNEGDRRQTDHPHQGHRQQTAERNRQGGATLS